MADPKPTGPRQTELWAAKRQREERATRAAATAFIVAILGAFGLLIIYLTGGQTQLEGVALFVSFCGVGTGLGIWANAIIDEPEVVEERPSMRSAQRSRDAFASEYEDSIGEIGRRPFLLKLLAGVGASLSLALVIPFRSLGPGPKRELFTTGWLAGERLVTAEGEPVRADDLGEDQVVTVFPATAVLAGDEQTMADSQAVVVGLRPDLIDAASFEVERTGDLACFSKICTHAGCPVGLYRAAAGELLCPCHQSTFDVHRAAAVKSGPAGRALPGLPIGVDAEGFLVALGPFDGPVGPAFWDMTHEQPDVASRGSS